MAILNLTPDSFYANSRVKTEALIETVDNFIKAGADIIDIGGYSSRPGAIDISVEEERERVIDAIQFIRSSFPDVIISIDTFRSQIAREAIKAGANMINDISGGEADPDMFNVVAECNVPYIMMHMRGTPKTMQNLTNYSDLVGEIIAYFDEKIHNLKKKGVKDIIIDPGFGFSKTVKQNFNLIKNLADLKMLGCPILVGVSRKSFIYKSLGINANEALNGSVIVNTLAANNGASILRVHDVKETKELVNLLTFMRDETES